MNALPIWDDEPRFDDVPVPDTSVLETDSPFDPFATLPADPRRTVLLAAIQNVGPDVRPESAVLGILSALDDADAGAGIARVDTHDAVLQQRIARMILGTNLPSRGPATRAREILAMLRSLRTA